jgi:hypothetical protein
MRRRGRLSHPAAARKFEARPFLLVAYVILSVNIHDALFDAARCDRGKYFERDGPGSGGGSVLRPMSYAMSFLQHAAKERSRPKKIDDRPQTRTGWLSNFPVTSLCPEKYSVVLLPTQHRRRGGRPPSRFAVFTRQGWQTNPRVPGFRYWLPSGHEGGFKRCRSIAPRLAADQKVGPGCRHRPGASRLLRPICRTDRCL